MLKNLAKQYGITSTAGLVEDYEAWLEGNKTFEEVDESELANKRTSFGIWIEDAKTGKGTAIPYSNLEPFYRDGKIDTRYNGDGTYTIIWLK